MGSEPTNARVGAGRPARRFDVVVWNHRRLESFARGFARVRGFDPDRDRLTIVSCSPCEQESEVLRAFERGAGIPVRYLTRRNAGREQLARLEYFTGRVGSRRENLARPWVLQMQDHYLDPELPASRWDDRRVKGDVVPDGVVLDLDRMERLAAEHALDGFFADRNRPCLVRAGGARFIAPNGSNFAVRTELLRGARTQAALRRMRRAFRDDVTWLTYMEYGWGPVLFHEGRRFYDLARERVFSEFRAEDFYVSPDDYLPLFRAYDRPAVEHAARRLAERGERAAAAAGARVVRPLRAARGAGAGLRRRPSAR